MWSKIVGGKSVHLFDWPEACEIDEDILADMAEVRQQVNESLALRAKNGVKIRQPLAKVMVAKNGEIFDFAPILMEELNVKAVEFGSEETALDFNLTDELKAEGSSREIIRHIQNSRKQAGLNIDDRIKLGLETSSESLLRAIDKFEAEIAKEVLAEEFAKTALTSPEFETIVKIDGGELKISLNKQ